MPYGWHYKPFVQEAKRLMDEGTIGRVEYALCHMASPTKDFFSGGTTVPSQWTPTVAEPDPATWQTKEHGGGYGHGQVTHASALLFWLTALRAREVSARTTSPGAPVDLYNAAAIVFEDGAIGALSGAGTLPNDDRFQVDLRLFGDEGVLLLDLERDRLDVRRHDGAHPARRRPARSGRLQLRRPAGTLRRADPGPRNERLPGRVGGSLGRARRGDAPLGRRRRPAGGGVPVRRLEERVAIVTGAGQGIGAATAARLCEEGARVAVAKEEA